MSQEVDPKPPLPLPKPQRIARISGQLLLELLVVFAGVYAAFLISEYQQDRQAETRRGQLRAALVEEIEVITSNTRPVAESFPGEIALLDSLIGAGARPPLEPMLGLPRFDTHMWKYALESEALDLFDVASISALSDFYNELNIGLEQIEQLSSLSESVLLPSLNAGPDEFYDPVTGELRPKYLWYIRGTAELVRIAARITEQGDSLVSAMTP